MTNRKKDSEEDEILVRDSRTLVEGNPRKKTPIGQVVVLVITWSLPVAGSHTPMLRW